MQSKYKSILLNDDLINKNTIIVIPARRNSKGLPFKNRLLFEETTKQIPSMFYSSVYVCTDDELLVSKSLALGLNIIERPEELSLDTTSTKEVLLHCNKNILVNDCKNIVMLYLTYPERKWKDVIQAYEFFVENKAESVLCKKDVKVSPFLMMYELPENKGSQIISHDLYRRQDYNPVFEISHYVFITNKSCLPKLNNNLYNSDTLFFKIDNKDLIDVDTQEDFNEYTNKEHNGR